MANSQRWTKLNETPFVHCSPNATKSSRCWLEAIQRLRIDSPTSTLRTAKQRESNAVEVTFTRTGNHRYRVSVDGTGMTPLYMEPAAGWNARMPHDMAHFIVENELGIKGGVFGQLAAGGTARTFSPVDQDKRRKLRKRGKRLATTNQKDAELSERLISIVTQVWQNKADVTSFKEVATDDLKRVVREFEAASSIWSKLAIGESMTLTWRVAAGRTDRRKRR